MKVLRNILILFLLISGCQKEKITIVTTADVSSITQTSAICGGEVISEGKYGIIEKGVCWNISDNPSILNNKTIDGSGLGSFTSDILGLDPGTTYFVRAYATNISGNTYGELKSFTTQPASIPELITYFPYYVIAPSTTLTSGGTITSDGASLIIDRGICWSRSENPTLSNNYISIGQGSDTFRVTLIGLEYNTCYSVRAYATNLVGTGYGNSKKFATYFPDARNFSPDSILGKWNISFWLYWNLTTPGNDNYIDEYTEDKLFLRTKNGIIDRQCKYSITDNLIKYSDTRFLYRIKFNGDNLAILYNGTDTLGNNMDTEMTDETYLKRLK